MDYSDLMFVLRKTELQLLKEIADQISAVSQVTVMKPAGTSLVMMGTKDSVQEVPFYLGEVLITQCAVAVNDITGYGFVMGEEPERAFCLAVLEAVLRGDSPQKVMVGEFVSRQKERMQHDQRREYAAVSQTRVRFDSMEEVS